MTNETKHYVSIFASFDTFKEADAFLLEHGVKQSIPKGGPVFSYSQEDESKYRNSHDALVEALKSLRHRAADLAGIEKDRHLPEYDVWLAEAKARVQEALENADEALKQAGVE